MTQTSHRNQGRMERRDRECCPGEYGFSRGERGRHYAAYQRGTRVTVLGLEAPETRPSREMTAPERGSRSGEGVQTDHRCDDGADWASERQLPATKTDSG